MRKARFVVAILPTTERAEIRELQLYAAMIAVAVVLVAAAAAWFLAGRVVAPVNELTETARSISESELGRRIRVRGTDEVANMGRTFNAMLDRLEAVYRSQREFLRAAGHEFRTPLTVATGHLELLADGTTPEERDATIALVLDELRRMGRVTDDLQALAEAERADFLAPQQVDFRELADQLITKASALGERDWQLDEVAGGSFVADRARITQAVLNLADNAVKNTEEGATIAIGIGIRVDDVHIWVRDTGVGIPEEERERILERFVRGQHAGRRYRGAGLGLAIVTTVAKAHGGHVNVESRPARARGSPWSSQERSNGENPDRRGRPARVLVHGEAASESRVHNQGRRRRRQGDRARAQRRLRPRAPGMALPSREGVEVLQELRSREARFL